MYPTSVQEAIATKAKWNWITPITIVLTFAPISRADPPIQCATKDGLAIEITSESLVKVGQQAFPLSTETLVWVRDAVVKGSQFTPVRLEYSGAAAVSGRDRGHPLGLHVQLVLAPHDD